MCRYQRFTGKSVVVTGAASGMGKAITVDFLKEGANVVAVDIHAEALEELKKVVSEKAEEYTGTLITFCGDIALQETNENMIDTALNKFGKLDCLVVNAGVGGRSETITELTNEAWETVMRVNLYGPMYAIRKAVSVMLEQETGGNIVSIASVAGIRGCRSSVQYTAAKHGLVGLCEHTAYAYMHDGIRSNLICPGAIKTGMTTRGIPESEFGASRIWSGMDSHVQTGVPADISQAVLYLASDEARFINGATLVIDGGMSCN